MYFAAGIAEEDAGPGGMERMRLQNQRHLPWLGEKAPMDFLVRIGKQDFTARVRVVPTHRLQAVPGGRGEQTSQLRLIPRGKRERRAEGVFAIERGIIGNGQLFAIPMAAQNAADFGAAAGQGKEGVHHRQPDIVESSR
jgi:hypothetical protein